MNSPSVIGKKKSKATKTPTRKGGKIIYSRYETLIF